jgi:hypothetical protein
VLLRDAPKQQHDGQRCTQVVAGQLGLQAGVTSATVAAVMLVGARQGECDLRTAQCGHSTMCACTLRTLQQQHVESRLRHPLSRTALAIQIPNAAQGCLPILPPTCTTFSTSRRASECTANTSCSSCSPSTTALAAAGACCGKLQAPPDCRMAMTMCSGLEQRVLIRTSASCSSPGATSSLA